MTIAVLTVILVLLALGGGYRIGVSRRPILPASRKEIPALTEGNDGEQLSLQQWIDVFRETVIASEGVCDPVINEALKVALKTPDIQSIRAEAQASAEAKYAEASVHNDAQVKTFKDLYEQRRKELESSIEMRAQELSAAQMRALADSLAQYEEWKSRRASRIELTGSAWRALLAELGASTSDEEKLRVIERYRREYRFLPEQRARCVASLLTDIYRDSLRETFDGDGEGVREEPEPPASGRRGRIGRRI